MNITSNTTILNFLSFLYAKNCSILKNLISQTNACRGEDVDKLASIVIETSDAFNKYIVTFKEVDSFLSNTYPPSNISEGSLRSIQGFIDFCNLRKELVASIISAVERTRTVPINPAAKAIDLTSLPGYNNSSIIH